MIAVVIDDMGLNEARSQRTIDLPGPLALSFLTYARDLPSWVARARAAGHEVLAHLPMEPLDPSHDPGPDALRVSMSPGEVRAAVAARLDGWSGYVGVNNHMGSRFCQDRRLMDAMMHELKSRGLFWLDSRTTERSVGIAAAKDAGVASLERFVFLDVIDDTDAVLGQLRRLERRGRWRGRAIGIGHPHEATIQALAQWLPTLQHKRRVLVPITALLPRSPVTRR